MSFKVGIITYYNAINSGAFLQAYSLGKFLEEEFFASVLYVDNCYVDIFREQRKQLLKSKNPIVLCKNYSRCRAIKLAQEKYLKAGDADSQYDCVVIGSDEMWNVENPMFSKYNIGEGIKTKFFLSYAVSVGNFTGVLSDYVIDSICKCRKISVRDYNSYAVIGNNLKKEVLMHVDPVFLIDIPAEDSGRDIGKYVLIYGSFSGKQAHDIQKFAHSIGCKTLSVDIMNAWCDVNFVAKSPFEFVGYIDKAHFIITNMFHGTMLSIARNRNFISVLTERRKGKIKYAAELFGVKDRCIDGNLTDENYFKWLMALYEKRINFERVNRIVSEQREISRQYFKSVMISRNPE